MCRDTLIPSELINYALRLIPEGSQITMKKLNLKRLNLNYPWKRNWRSVHLAIQKEFPMRSIAMKLATILFICFATTSAAFAEDIERGKKIFRQCLACHTIDEGAQNKVGPALHGIFGRLAAKADGFNYSRALRSAGRKGLIWSEKNLNAYLTSPSKFLPKNKMAFVGIKKKSDRLDLIAYLKSLAPASDSIEAPDTNP